MDKDKDRATRIEAVFKSGVEKRREIMATIAAVRGEPYADAIYTAVVVFNTLNATARACQDGMVAQQVQMVLAVIGPAAQDATIVLLMAHKDLVGANVDDVVRDVNSLLDLVEVAAVQMGAGS